MNRVGASFLVDLTVGIPLCLPPRLVVLIVHGGVFAVSEAGAGDVKQGVKLIGVSTARHCCCEGWAGGFSAMVRAALGALGVEGGVVEWGLLCFEFVSLQKRKSKSREKRFYFPGR